MEIVNKNKMRELCVWRKIHKQIITGKLHHPATQKLIALLNAIEKFNESLNYYLRCHFICDITKWG